MALIGVLSYYAIYYLENVRGVTVGGSFWSLVAILVAVTFVVMYSVGLYNKESIISPLKNLSKLIIVFICSPIVIDFAMQIYVKFSSELNPIRFPFGARAEMLMLFIAASFLVILTTRLLFVKLVDLQLLQKNILILGTGRKAEKLETFMLQHENKNFVHLRFASVADEEILVPREKIVFYRNLSNISLNDAIKHHHIDELVVASDDRRGLPIDAILACKLAGMRVTEYLAFYEREAGRVDLDALQPSWLVFSDGFSLKWWDVAIKRTFDVVVSLLFLAFTLPITLITAVLVRLDSPGPIFYRQERVGQNGQTFTLMKFRSMRTDAESSGPQWAAQNDNRITRIGEFIRQTRIDEIPQIINVLRGDMSFIGPRPERPFFVDSLSRHVPYYRERHRMKPGITGWAQINYPYGASIADAKEKMSYDLYYLKNFTIFLDVLILLQTARVVLWPAGVR
jgi:sugar transferase (PEP-CTERM system associated)